MDYTTLTKVYPSSAIIEKEVFRDKSSEELLLILKISRWLSIDAEFPEGVTKKPAGIDTPKESTTILTTRLRSKIYVYVFHQCVWKHHTFL